MSILDNNLNLGLSQTVELPPYSNTGVTHGGKEKNQAAKIAVSIDWLQYSVSWENDKIPTSKQSIQDQLKRAVMPSEAIKLTGEIKPNQGGYNTTLGLTRGSVRYHSDNAVQKIGVVFTGKDLSALYNQGVDPLSLLSYAIKIGAKISRLDLAVDYFGKSNPLDIDKAWDVGDLKTVAQTTGLVLSKSRDKSKGKTVYVGSRSSERFMRVYDKALEEGEDRDWTRIELELKRRRAQSMGIALAGLGTDYEKFSELVRAAIRDFCEAPTVGWYTDALTGPVVELPRITRRDTATKEWLLNQVLPAFVRELADGEKAGDWEVYDAFYSEMSRYLAR